jgi:hypothetical protein
MKTADVMANEKLYNAALAQAQEANDRAVWGHDAKKDRNGRWIEQSIPLNLNHFAALRKAEGDEAYWLLQNIGVKIQSTPKRSVYRNRSAPLNRRKP